MRRLWFPLGVMAALGLVALLAPVLPLADPVRQDIAHRLAPPSAAALLGYDELGRDVLARLIFGARASLGFAFVAVAIACAIGTAVGIAAGWLKGVTSLLAIRGVDVILCFPPILFAMLLVTLLGPGSGTLVLVMSVLLTPGFVKVAYGETVSVSSRDFTEAVVALGAPTPRIMALTILPNIIGPVLVQFSLTMSAALIMESALSFLGLGVVPPTPSWGRMLASARTTMQQAPLLILWPSLALVATIMAMNAVCDRLRDIIDPRGAALPGRRLAPAAAVSGEAAGAALVEARGLTIELATPAGPVMPAADVSFSLGAGETLAIVGESGSGKSITALALMGLLPDIGRIASGSATVAGTDIGRASEDTLRRLRGREAAMVFQDPMSSLHPMHRIGEQVAEAIRAHESLSARAARVRALALFRRVGIADPERRLDAYPHEISGGMRQRVMIAMAIANHPRLLIADEPTTALDVTIQAQIVDLLKDLQRENGMGMIFISHNLALVSEVADRVLVMYAGEVVEEGPAGRVLAAPKHPYTAALLASLPEGDRDPVGIAGMVPPLDRLPAGCRFAPRCAHAAAACAAPQALQATTPGWRLRCARWREIGEPVAVAV